MTAPEAMHLILPLWLVAAVASYWGTKALIGVLAARAILDRPNERSSHTRPTPRGGGIAVIGTLVPAWIAIALIEDQARLVDFLVPAIAAALALLSWRDDRAGLPVPVRFAAQAAAVVATLAAVPDLTNGFDPFLRGWPGTVLIALAWIWFINLYNFMDGIDGIAGVETASIGLGVVAAASAAMLDWSVAAMGITAVAAALGFLRWNRHPAQIFLGDVGSIPLGYLLGWLLLLLAVQGQWAAALILPAYYLADATLTLLGRLVRGERVWQAHRSHFYQRAAASGWSHGQVVQRIAFADIALIVAAVIAASGWPLTGLAMAAVVVVTLLVLLARGKPRRGP
ncbi:MAG: glycosyltransferase family 4 protein [Alphaproteobacteria bacterium]|nr:glycosyltransferase family 4 protein [Alphaproteobacteria bacterium]